MLYGYARCSTNEKKQDIDRQKRELKKLGVDADNIFWEYESGMKNDRVQLDRLLTIAEEGDTIIVLEVSRLTRSPPMTNIWQATKWRRNVTSSRLTKKMLPITRISYCSFTA